MTPFPTDKYPDFSGVDIGWGQDADFPHGDYSINDSPVEGVHPWQGVVESTKLVKAMGGNVIWSVGIQSPYVCVPFTCAESPTFDLSVLGAGAIWLELGYETTEQSHTDTGSAGHDLRMYRVTSLDYSQYTHRTTAEGDYTPGTHTTGAAAGFGSGTTVNNGSGTLYYKLFTVDYTGGKAVIVDQLMNSYIYAPELVDGQISG